MAFTVLTHFSEDDLATYLTAVVTTFTSEDDLEVGVAAATSVFAVVNKGGHYTLIDNPQIVNVSLEVLAKGAEYTTILETA